MDNKQRNFGGVLSRVAQIIELETEKPRKIMIEVNVRDIGEKDTSYDGSTLEPPRDRYDDPRSREQPQKDQLEEHCEANDKVPYDDRSSPRTRSIHGESKLHDEDHGGILPSDVKEAPGNKVANMTPDPAYGSGNYAPPPPVVFPEDGKTNKAKKKEVMDPCEIRGYEDARKLKKKKGHDPCSIKTNGFAAKNPPPPPTTPSCPLPPSSPPQRQNLSVPATGISNTSERELTGSAAPASVKQDCLHQGIIDGFTKNLHEGDSSDPLLGVPEYVYHIDDADTEQPNSRGSTVVYIITKNAKDLPNGRNSSTSIKTSVIANTRSDSHALGDCAHGKYEECKVDKLDLFRPMELYLEDLRPVIGQIRTASSQNARAGIHGSQVTPLFQKLTGNYPLMYQDCSDFSGPITLANEESRQIKVRDLAYEDNVDDDDDDEKDANHQEIDDEDSEEVRDDVYIPSLDTPSYIHNHNSGSQELCASEKTVVTDVLLKMGLWVKSAILPEYRGDQQ